MDTGTALEIYALTPEEVTREKVQERYRALAKEHHPDRHMIPSKKAEAHFNFILANDARDILLAAIDRGELPKRAQKYTFEDREDFDRGPLFRKKEPEKPKRPWPPPDWSPRKVYDHHNKTPFDKATDSSNNPWTTMLFELAMIPGLFLFMFFMIPGFFAQALLLTIMGYPLNEIKKKPPKWLDQIGYALYVGITLVWIPFLLYQTWHSEPPIGRYVVGSLGIIALFFGGNELYSVIRYKHMVKRYRAAPPSV